MNIWANTKTLDGWITTTKDKENADIILLGGKSISLEDFPNVKGIFRVGVGRDNVPFEGAKERNIIVGFPSESTTNFIYEETANFTCYLIMKMLYSSVGCVDRWEKNNRKFLSDYVLLVVGVGNIGKIVQQKMKGFLQVKTFDILNNDYDDLKELFSEAECISLHIPLSEDTVNFIDAEKISWMKQGSFLINTARGSVVSEDDLYDAIKNNKIEAAFDVFWDEPYNGKLKEFINDGFYMTPHVASTNEKFLECASDDLFSFMDSL